MKLKQIPFIIFFLITASVFAQQKEITLEEIWGGAFRIEYLDRLRSLNNGTEYSLLEKDENSDNRSINVYNYESGEMVRTLLDSKSVEGLDTFSGYTFSADESKVLLSTEVQSIYRRSTLAVYYIYDFAENTLVKVADEPIQEPTFSQDAGNVAYGKDNNLYIKNLNDGKTLQITDDGKKNAIINGITDWVYEEEFSLVRAFDWNRAGNKIAYIRFDESEVPEFSMDVFGAELYPQQGVFKYPKAGEANAKVSLHIYDMETKETIDVNLDDFDHYYMPRLAWSNNENTLAVQSLDRKQNAVNLIFVDGNSGEARLVLRDEDEAYVDVTDNLTFLEDNSFIWTSEKDGWNQIYHYNEDGKLKNKVTQGNWDVTAYYGYDQQSNRVFYQSTENGSINRGVYSVKLNVKGK
ncbi:MAG: DPP IV N-terminal domain-containing protein, partial [Leeuwenhoekiella sp.]